MEVTSKRKGPRLSVIRMTRIAVFAALLCVAAPWSIPIGPIPLSLATFVVYLTGALLGLVDGTIAVAVYLLLGAVGVPVFSGFTGGIQKLLGVTGGYLVGYLPCVAIVGAAADHTKKHRWLVAVAMVAGTALLYALGTVWFMLQSGRTLAESMSLCVLPFLPGDAAKIAVASALSIPLRAAMEKLLTRRSLPPSE